jgi:hypothetical protein
MCSNGDVVIARGFEVCDRAGELEAAVVSCLIVCKLLLPTFPGAESERSIKGACGGSCR